MSDEQPRQPAPRSFRLGFYLSAVLHVVLVGLLIWLPYRYWFAVSDDAKPQRQAASSSSAKTGSPQTNAEPSPAEPTPQKVEEVAVAKLEEYKEAAEELSDEEKLARLKQVTERLEQISSEESLEKIADNFSKWFGTSKRATEPKEPAEGSPPARVDASTGEIHDVLRTKDADGNWKYTAILVDAEGNSMKVEFEDRALGEKTYQTFQLIKSSPLLNKVYRDMVMPLLDKAAKAQKEAERENRRKQNAAEGGDAGSENPSAEPASSSGK